MPAPSADPATPASRMQSDKPRVTGLVLAGGLGRRMSSDGAGINKALQPFRKSTLIEHVLERLVPQVDQVLINMNARTILPEACKFPIISDELSGFQGPLAGMHAGMKAARTGLLLCVPCDSPFLPNDLCERMLAAIQAGDFDLCVASSRDSGNRCSRCFNVGWRNDLEQFLRSGERKVEHWFRRHRSQVVEFDDTRAFLNFNTIEELHRHEH